MLFLSSTTRAALVLSIGIWVLAGVVAAMAPVAHAQSIALPDDIIESPGVKKADIPAHFKNIFGRDGAPGEVKYWETRLKDKPRELEFLAAMGYWAARGSSPTIENNKFSLTLSNTGRDIFVGETRRHVVTVSHTNPVKQSGYLDLKIDARDVKPTAPLPNVQRTYVGGITRLRHQYNLAPEEELTVDLVVTILNQPKYTFTALLHGRGVSKQHVTTVYSRVPETLPRPTYQERQIPLMFARVYGRTPNKRELTEWRKRLTKTHRLETIQGAMEVARLAGNTLPPGAVLGVSTGVPIENINSLFRSVYGRSPTALEWHYWASRRADKADAASFIGALEYHKLSRQAQ